MKVKLIFSLKRYILPNIKSLLFKNILSFEQIYIVVLFRDVLFRPSKRKIISSQQ